MKILVCTDGSEHSQKAVEVASKIAEGCNPDEVAIIYVHTPMDAAFMGGGASTDSMEVMRKLKEQQVEEGKKILERASAFFEEKNIKSSIMQEEGHPAATIVRVAAENNLDMIVIGSRGRGGWKKRILGSVSSAVVQEAKNCSVVTVK